VPTNVPTNVSSRVPTAVRLALEKQLGRGPERCGVTADGEEVAQGFGRMWGNRRGPGDPPCVPIPRLRRRPSSVPLSPRPLPLPHHHNLQL